MTAAEVLAVGQGVVFEADPEPCDLCGRASYAVTLGRRRHPCCHQWAGQWAGRTAKWRDCPACVESDRRRGELARRSAQ